MKGLFAFGIPLGFSTTFWGMIGLLRWLCERFHITKDFTLQPSRYAPADVAVLLPAHNEGLVIQSSIQALKQSFTSDQIYVASDGSTDNTYDIAVKERCHTVQLPGIGKAKALTHLLQTFDLFDRHRLIFIVDADTQIDKHFIARALPMFNDPEISVVFAEGMIHWPDHIMPMDRLHFVAYRERLNRMLEYFLVYGQTWKYTNVNFVIPGFCTIYRSDILRQLQIDTPGLLIEDFNLAFQLHRKKLGKIGYKPSLIGWEWYPETLSDYWRQVRRWNIGFFQTVRRNGFWPSFFWFSMAIFSIEVLLQSVFIVFLPFLVLYLLLYQNPAAPAFFTPFLQSYEAIGPYQRLSLELIVFSVLVTDYFVTVLFAFTHRKPQLLFYGLFFFYIHYVTSLILITAIIPGFFKSSDGRWISPTRTAA